MFNYTVIIPHHNIPSLLQRCINSIPNRGDIQVIIVDDNSDSGLVDFSSFPGKNREGVECYFDKSGLGAGHARNIGLEKASGKWVIFADADDFFSDDAFATFDKYLNSEDDIVYFMIDSYFSNTLQPAKRHLSRSINIEHYSRDKKELDAYLRYGCTEPWAKIIKKSLIDINHIEFQETKCANDYLFSVRTGYLAKSISLDNNIVYSLTVRDGSLSYDYFTSYESALIRFKVYKDVQLFFKTNKINIRPYYAWLGSCIIHNHSILNKFYKVMRDENMNVPATVIKSVIVTITNLIFRTKRFTLPYYID